MKKLFCRARLVVFGCALAGPLFAAPVQLVEQPPVAITTPAPGVWLVDFGRVAYGNLRLTPPAGATGEVTVHFGEAFAHGRINRHPPGSVRYSMVALPLAGGKSLVAAPPADPRNTKQPNAVLTPHEWGVVTPFRWVEIEGWPGELQANQILRRAAFSSTWDDQAAAFECSDEMLNHVWELCRYSIKATTFAGIYVDGDRERTAYEADAYLDQLGHYACAGDIQMARDTFDRLTTQPTWPTEWADHMIFIAHADWLQTGDKTWLAAHYATLQSKLAFNQTRADGLVVSPPARVKHGDIVDWPGTERDGYVFTPVNTVINAFHLRSLARMAELAAALDRDADAANYAAQYRTGLAAFQEKLFDSARGVYRDGEGTEHASQHANAFPLAFGLVPLEHRASVTAFAARRGMACSVYGAQYLLEGLFENDASAPALALITAFGDRSWRHMVESGTTITWEAWDQRYKPNQDWNHAWGAAPANLLPRFVLGAQPLTPGWSRARIRPNPGNLSFASGKIPTPRGPVLVSWKNGPAFTLSLTLPTDMTAQVELPATAAAQRVFSGGQPVSVHRVSSRWVLDKPVSGQAQLEVR